MQKWPVGKEDSLTFSRFECLLIVRQQPLLFSLFSWPCFTVLLRLSRVPPKEYLRIIQPGFARCRSRCPTNSVKALTEPQIIAEKNVHRPRRSWSTSSIINWWKGRGIFNARCTNVETVMTHSHTRNHFTALYPGLPGWAGARRNLVDFMVLGKITEADNPAWRHSMRTNKQLTSLIPPFLRHMPFLLQPSQFILACGRHQMCWLDFVLKEKL